ncbi:HEPN domain-containing protein [Rhizobium leguminosarum]|nr:MULTISPECIES: nucleotidyltransferase and HEPN domain-containing protein [Rhizobium]MCJ9693357.1 nucleotidyltransferase and HEPN domain-containing protein [Rhizobium sp. PRIMUS64]MDV4159645.1 nucleotidyltransferase and HEPN domain-containing protein [Rhizobium leguminosarum]MDV4174401.1 nucleotidyltransferase and HEPN domain-containing protein [Rhizobium leguminosarum]NKK45992.1 HEPN domain-containing protein [Rhizobium leguminosarum bv. viciae]TAU19459.1 HEPN domain-containing protein [Rhiz
MLNLPVDDIGSFAYRLLMKSSLDHMPLRKQRELGRVLEILHEEFEDALKEGTADFKKRGRILKILLFGSYAKGGWVDEPFTMKGYRSDFDLLIIVNNRKLCEFTEYWHKAADRLIHEASIETPVSFIVHSRREVNTYLKEGQYFFSDIRKEGIVLYELDDEPLAEPEPLSAEDRLRLAKEIFEQRFAEATTILETAKFQLSRSERTGDAWINWSAFSLHQSLEQAYSCVLLTLTNYGPPSHNLKFLRSLAEEQDRRLAEAFPRDQHRERAWFNTLNEAYVKARYSKHFEISEEALGWLAEQTALLLELVKTVCEGHLEVLKGIVCSDVVKRDSLSCG